MSDRVLQVTRIVMVSIKDWDNIVPNEIKFSMYRNRVLIDHKEKDNLRSSRWLNETMFINWCNENATGLCYLDNTQSNFNFSIMFEHENDMVAFKLHFDDRSY